jgi:isopenicillin N synthase-like dioxygenase
VIVGHDVLEQLSKDVHDCMTEFFAQPFEQKSAYTSPGGPRRAVICFQASRVSPRPSLARRRRIASHAFTDDDRGVDFTSRTV